MKKFYCALSLFASLSFLGCGPSAPATADKDAAAVDDHDHDHDTEGSKATDHAAHDHPTEGPHGGDLIELGNEEYHAEFLHNKLTKAVTIHILDASAKKTVAIPADEITINVQFKGKGSQFKLTPQREEGKTETATFTYEEADLGEAIDAEGAKAQLVVDIHGKPFRGDVAHDHDHDH